LSSSLLTLRGLVMTALKAVSAPQPKAAPQPKSKSTPATAQLLFATELAKKRVKGFFDHSTELMDNSGPNVGKPIYGTRDGTIYEFVDTHWQALDSMELERNAIDWLAKFAPDKCTDKTATSCVNTAILKLPKIPSAKENIIPLKYSSLEITNDGVLSERHSLHEDGLNYCLSCVYDKGAVAGKFLKFINEALPNEEMRNFLQEYIGYTLLGDTRHQVAAWLIGEGGTGKGTIATVTAALHKQTIALNLNALEGFRLAGLHSASLVLVDETPTRINEQTLKTLISGDMIQIDRKYRDMLTLRPTAKWLVNGNSLPAISDHSTGFWRRWFIFPFNVVPSKKQPMLAQQIIDEELSGVLNWALEGLQRLLKRNGFPEQPAEMKNATSHGKMQSNNVAAWVVDMGIETVDNHEIRENQKREDSEAIIGIPVNQVWNTRKDVYFAYSRWCGESGTRAVASNKFFERLQQVFPSLQKERRSLSGERDWYVSISLPSSRD
jgi:putative DNA primase/helicase